MDEPQAWRDLAERFTQLYAGGADKLCAEWISSSWNEQGDQWLILGVEDPALRGRFESTAERAAVLLGHESSGLFFWLNLLKDGSPNYISGGLSRTWVGDH